MCLYDEASVPRIIGSYSLLNIEDIMLSSIKLSKKEKKAGVPTCRLMFAAAAAAGSTGGVVQ
jgi:hypothetical protein